MTIISTPDVLGGDPRLEDRRISVLQVVQPVLDGHDPAVVADQLDISLAEVHEALSYYYANPVEMERIREVDEQLEDELRELSNAPREVRG